MNRSMSAMSETSEEIASLSLAITTNGVIKLRVNKSESWRRIPLFRLEENVSNSEESKNETKLSFEKLCKYAILYSGLDESNKFHVDENNLENFDVKLSYKDEDGDTIEISTEEEVVDIVSSKRSKNEVLYMLATVAAKEKAPCSINPSSLVEDSQRSKPLNEMVDAIFNFVTGSVELLREELKTEQEQTKSALKAPTSEEQQTKDETKRVELSFDPHFVHIRHTCDGCGLSPIVGHRYHATNIPDFDLCAGCKDKCEISDLDLVQAQDGVGEVPNQYEGFDSSFVHCRHTCDGCGTSPIVGYRWHATNIPNYDLCHACKSKTVCTDVFFQLAQYKADRSFSFRERRCKRHHRWNKQNSCHMRASGNSGERQDVSSEKRDDIEKAIELSLVELKSKTRSFLEKQQNLLKKEMEATEEASFNERNKECKVSSTSKEVETNDTKLPPKANVTKPNPVSLNNVVLDTHDTKLPIVNDMAEDLTSFPQENTGSTLETKSLSQESGSNESGVSSPVMSSHSSLIEERYDFSESKSEESLSNLQQNSNSTTMEESIDLSTRSNATSLKTTSEASLSDVAISSTANTSIDAEVVTHEQIMNFEKSLANSGFSASTVSSNFIPISSTAKASSDVLFVSDDIQSTPYHYIGMIQTDSVDIKTSNDNSSASGSDPSISFVSIAEVKADEDSTVPSIVQNSVESKNESESKESLQVPVHADNKVILNESDVNMAEDLDSASIAESEDSWDIVDDTKVHENIGALLFQKGLN